jgi:transposase
MSRKYLPVNREKPMFLPLDMQEWVPRDHFVWFLIDVAGQLDISAVEAGTSPGKGRPGYDPRMLVTLVMYAMSCGERSSRQIEDRTRVDAAFRIASGNQFPDHSTLCRFRQRTGGEDGPLEDLFTQVLYVCAVAGLGRLRVISVDGSKVWADAAKEANRTLAGLRKLSRQVLQEAAAADGECGCEGHGHGEAAGAGGGGCPCCAGGMLAGLGLCGPAVLPRGWGGASRATRIAAALADLEAAREAEDAARRQQADAYLAKTRAGQAPPGRVPDEVAVTVAEIALEQATAAQQARCDAYGQRVAASAGRGVPGARPAPPEQAAAVRRCRERLAAARKAAAARAAHAAAGQDPPGGAGTGKGTRRRGKKPPQPVRNITDPDSRAMHCTRNGTVQAYNCQLPRADDGLVLAARATQDVNDAAQVEPTLAGITAAQQVIAAGHRAGGHCPAWSRIGTVVYDGGYFSAKNCAAEGPDRLISPGSWESARSSGPHTPACRHQDPRDQMAHNMSTRQGRDLYRRRAPLSEGGFSFLKDTIGLRRFSMRGLPLVQAELTLAATVSNLMLLHRRLPSLPRPATRPALPRSTTPASLACPEQDLPPRQAGPPQAREHQEPAIPSLARPSKARNPRPAPDATAHRTRRRESSATRPICAI